MSKDVAYARNTESGCKIKEDEAIFRDDGNQTPVLPGRFFPYITFMLCVNGVLQVSDVIDFLCMLLRKPFHIITFTRKYIYFYG